MITCSNLIKGVRNENFIMRLRKKECQYDFKNKNVDQNNNSTKSLLVLNIWSNTNTAWCKLTGIVSWRVCLKPLYITFNFKMCLGCFLLLFKLYERLRKKQIVLFVFSHFLWIRDECEWKTHQTHFTGCQKVWPQDQNCLLGCLLIQFTIDVFA